MSPPRSDLLCWWGKVVVERALAAVRLRVRVALAVASIAAGICAVGLSGCGRAGPLELPPGPATPASSAQLSPDGAPVPGSPQDTAMRTGFDAQGNPVAATGQKRPFILDPLLQ
jgi:predicted small lipoprotein YifL